MRARVLVGLSLAALLALPALAQRGDDSKRKSKNGHVDGKVDGVRVVIDYGRPEARGRDIWGTLVPWNEVWRTGADEATTVHFDRDVVVAGQPLAAGRYSLFTIPQQSGTWTVIFNKVADQWGAFKYDSSQDALRVSVQTASHDPAVEALTFTLEGDHVVLRWEKLELAIPVRAAG